MRTPAGYTRAMFEAGRLESLLGSVWVCSSLVLLGCEDPRKYDRPQDAALREDASDAQPVGPSSGDGAIGDTATGNHSGSVDASTPGVTLTGTDTPSGDASQNTTSNDGGGRSESNLTQDSMFVDAASRTDVPSSQRDAGTPAPEHTETSSSASSDTPSSSGNPGSSGTATSSGSDAGSTCADGGCEECGGATQACCADDECNPGLQCQDGTCVTPGPSNLVLDVSGLEGVLVLALNDDTLAITTNGESTIELELEIGQTLTLTIDTDPLDQRCLLDGEAEFEDQFAGGSYSLKVECEDDVADLRALTSSVPGLSFASDTLSYELNAPFSRYSITLTATAEQESATVRIDGNIVPAGEEITLSLPTGLRTIPVEVQAESGLERTYELEVRRAAELEFVQRLVSEEDESVGFGGGLAVDGDEFAVLTSGIVNNFDAAVTLFDFDNLEPVRHFGSLQPMDYFSPEVAFDSGHLLFTASDYISMSLWTARNWDSRGTLAFVMDQTQYFNAVRFGGSISGDTLVIGGIWTQIVYSLVEGAWQEQQRLYPLHGTEVEVDYELFALPLFVKLVGDTLVVAGQVTSTEASDPTSVVRIYQRANGVFGLVASPDIVPEALAVGPNVVAIGDTNSTHIYQRSGDTWSFQRDVSASRAKAVHGPYLVSASDSISSTSVTVSSWDSTQSTASSTVTLEDTGYEDDCSGFGRSVAMNENGLLVGGCDSVFVFR